MVENVIGFVGCLLCAFPFFIVGYFQRESNEPIVFWIRDDKRVKEKVKNVKDYNGEISKLFLYCALAFAVTGIVYFIHSVAAYVCLGLVCTLGIYIVWKRYKTILMKYS